MSFDHCKSDLRCVYCGHSPAMAGRADGVSLSEGCENCGHSADKLGQVSFMGGFEPSDFPQLVELIASGREPFQPVDVQFARRLERLLAEYHEAPDKAAFAEEHPDELVRAPWFKDSRYHDWMQTHALVGSLSLAEKDILCVAPGSAADAIPFVDACGKVTCLSSSPAVLASGSVGVPAARWVGGWPNAIPFVDEAFDVVFAQATLRRLKTRPAVLREMLRVLKPGGLMFTVGDPIRPDDSDDSLEFEVFNRHEGVLSGVNEGIIRFSDFYDTLAEFGDQIELALIASVQDPSALQGASPIGDGAFNDFWVPCWPENIEYLRQAHGAGLCVAVKKMRSIELPAERQSHYVLPAGVLASWIGNPQTAFSRLMAWAPDELLNLPFPGTAQDWFSLLNGWQRPEPGQEFRRGFQRARWLLRSPGATSLALSIRATDGPRDFEVYVNGLEANSSEIGSEWRRIEVEISDNSGGLPFLVELRVAGNLDGLTFDQRCFDVRDRVVA